MSESEFGNVCFSDVYFAFEASFKLALEHERIIYEEISRAFSPYQNNKSWLRQQINVCAGRISKRTAESFALYEDDERLLAGARFVIACYPIKDVVTFNFEPAQHNDGKSFEEATYSTLLAAGFVGAQIGGSGDQGADMFMSSDGISYVIQCKDHSKPVGNSSVQQALAAQAFYKADHAVVCSRSGFTRSAKILAIDAKVLLVNPSALAELATLARSII